MKNCAYGCRKARVLIAALVAVFVGLFPGGDASAAGAVIVYPPDRALLSGDGSLDVLGFLPGNSPGSVTINGSSGSRSEPAGTGAFTVKVKLDPGENSLMIKDAKVTIFVTGGANAAADQGFSPPDAHAVDNGCEECHAFSAGKATLLEKPPALCARCHDDVLKGKDGKLQAVLHPPAKEGDCLACHVFHGLSIKKLPAAAKRALCFGCHDDFTDDGKMRMHGPVAQGECTGCHGAHAAPGKKLLPATGVKLCLLCHSDPALDKTGKSWAVQHPALDDGCPTCHQPHVASGPGLLKKEQPTLCFDCHDAIVPPPAGKGGSIHLPVTQGACSRCHAPHGSGVKKLLRASPAKDLCLLCHKDPTRAPGGDAWAVQHPALDDGCPACHRPHVAAAPRLLATTQRALCTGCHEDKNLNGDGVAWSAPHTPVVAGMCASCHGVHGGPEKAMLKKSEFEICETCHTELHERHRVVELDPTTGLPASGKAQLPAGFPVRKKDGKLGCAGCHRPHGSDNRLLWNEDETNFCTRCHPI